jgi:hypothetical protein
LDDHRLADGAAGKAKFAVDGVLGVARVLQRVETSGTRVHGLRLHTEERNRDREHKHREQDRHHHFDEGEA